jgi:hypothetical protein
MGNETIRADANQSTPSHVQNENLSTTGQLVIVGAAPRRVSKWK